MQVNPCEIYSSREHAFLVTKKLSAQKNDNILMYLSILSFVTKFSKRLMLASCLEIWVVTLIVRLDVALLMRQIFANSSGITPDGSSACEALKKAADASSNNSLSSISSKGVVLLKHFGDSNISQSCMFAFVLHTATANFV